jgi:LacI family transcriptional regulator, gluconate utilization system Gnt-I transcriptional repressor
MSKSRSSPSGRTRRTPNIKDVARLAGISAITVSRALSRPDTVAKATRARIAQAIRKTGYIRNLSASVLVSRRSQVIGVITPTLTTSIFGQTLQGLADVFRPQSYELLITDTQYSAVNARAAATALLARQVDAIVHIGAIADAKTRALIRRQGVPVVETWDMPAKPLQFVVGISNQEAGELVAAHFLSTRRRETAFIGSNDPRALARMNAFVGRMAQAGAKASAFLSGDQPSFGLGRTLLQKALAERSPLHAVFCASDILAVGALLEAQHCGLRVPEDLAIVGLGDLEIAGHTSPALSTIHVPAYEIGTQAASVLLAFFEARRLPARVVKLPIELTVRQSS